MGALRDDVKTVPLISAVVRSSFVTVVWLVVGIQQCLGALDLPRNQILPYVQAEGTPVDKTRVIWLSATRVAFTASKPSTSWKEGRRNEDDVLHILHERVEEVLVFDVETGKTAHHADGMLRSFDDGTLTIVLEQVSPESFRRRGEPTGAYDVRLVGSPGKEQKVKYSRANDLKPIATCPGYAGTRASAATWRLKPQHGCLQHPGFNPGSAEPWTYYRADGTNVKLAVRTADVDPPVWIVRLNAYLLGDFVTKSEGRDGARSQSVAMMKPDGRVLTVDLEWGLTNVRPTRAGMTGVRFIPKLPKEYDGIYLWKGDAVLQVAEGYMVSGQRVEVSPDGCRLAYVWEWRGESKAKRLRVIDVCRLASSSAATGNPFEW